MKEHVDVISAVLRDLTQDEAKDVYELLRSRLPKHSLEAKWNISWEIILDAIERSQDITQRGVRGVIAEAVFEAKVLPKLTGWEKEPLNGEFPYDFKLKNTTSGRVITIQIKLQRTGSGVPLTKKSFYPRETYVVEVQRTRTGIQRRGKKSDVSEQSAATEVQTRPYPFGSFDILAVSMQPLTGDWTKFMYTAESWLIPRTKDANLIDILQPVSAVPTEVWTDRLDIAIEWVLSGEKKLLFDIAKAKAASASQREQDRIAKAELRSSAKKLTKIENKKARE